MCDCVSGAVGNFQLARLYEMSQVINCVCEETALSEIKRDISASEKLEDSTGMFDVSLGRLRENHDVLASYTRAYCPFTFARMTSMLCGNVLRSFSKPKGIQTKRCSSWSELNAVLLLSSSSFSNCQHSLLTSGAEKTVVSGRESMHSSMCGMGFESREQDYLTFYSLNKSGVFFPFLVQRL